MIILYTTHCPKCAVLAKKLALSGVEYEECTNTKEMLAKGIQTVPMLQVSENSILPFAQAIEWANKYQKEV